MKEENKVLNKVKLGIAPIGWTNDDLPELGGHIPFEQCISEMSEAGYTGSEVGNKYPTDPAELKAALEPKGLQICAKWQSVWFTEDGRYEESITEFKKGATFLAAMGANCINVCECGHCIQGLDLPVLGAEKPIFTEAQWQTLAKGLNECGQIAKEMGLKLVYHHHMGTGVQTRAEVDKLMSMTDENLVYLLADTGHIYISGDDPVALVKDYISRIKHVHLKDIRDNVLAKVKAENLSFLTGVKQGVFTVPGDGSINFDPIFKILDKADYEGWWVVEAEQDPDKANPLEYAKKAMTYIEEHAKLTIAI